MKTMKKRKFASLLCACLTLALVMSFFATNALTVSAKQKCSTKKVVTIYDSKGKAYKSGSKIPYSKLKNAKIKISGLKKNMAYYMTVIAVPAPYKYRYAKDDCPDWAFDQIIYNPSNKTSVKIAKKLGLGDKDRDYLQIYKLNKKTKYPFKNYVDKEYCNFTIIIQPVNAKGNMTKTYYENYFKAKF